MGRKIHEELISDSCYKAGAMPVFFYPAKVYAISSIPVLLRTA